MNAKEVQAFFERVATDWDIMRLAYYDECVIEKMAGVSGVGEDSEVADVWLGFEKGQVERFFRKAGLTGYGYEPLGMQ
jgi:hypothetical protein